MSDRVPLLRWGVGLENVLLLGYPIDNTRFGRRPRSNSRYGRSPTGVPDSLITGRDFTMAGTIRWVPRSPNPSFLPTTATWSGPAGVQAFLDWCHNGNTFRFVPDATWPLAYLDGCVLLEPAFDAGEPGSLEDDGSFQLPIVFAHPTADFGLLNRGLLIEYVPGASLTDPVAYTFTRASIARYHGASGVGAEATANTLRDRHYIGGVRGALLEGGRVNLVSAPENFGAWSDAGTPVKTGGQTDPFGGTAAYLLEDNDGAANETVNIAVVFTGDATKAFALYLKAGTATQSAFGLYDATAAAWRHLVRVTWTAGVPSLSSEQGSGVLFAVEAMMDSAGVATGWYRLKANAAGVIAANNNNIYIYPTGTTGSATGTVYAFGAHAQNALYCGSYTGPTTLTHAADALTVPFTWPVQDITVYAKLPRPDWADATGTLAHDCGAIAIGTDLSTKGALLYGSNTARAWNAWIGAAVAAQNIPAGTTQELCAQFRFATDGKCRLDVGSGFGSLSAAAADRTFQNATIRLGAYGVGAELDGALSVLRIAYGLRTLAEMQAL